MKNSIIKNKSFQKAIIYLISIITIYIFTIIFSSTYNNEVILPHPNEMIKAFFELLGTGRTYIYILNTLKALLISLIVSFIIGLLMGILAGVSRYIRYFFKPWITIMRCLPLAALIVLIMVIVNLKITPYIVSGLVLIPIIYESVVNSIVSIDKEYIDVYKLSSNINPMVIYKVYIPLILSGIKAAFISAVGLGIKVLIMAEFIIGAKDTLGYAIVPVIQQIEYAKGYAYCIIIVLVVLFVELIPNAIYKLITYVKFSRKKHSKF